MNKFLLGWSILSTLINIFVILLLYKKPKTENHIEKQSVKNKHNKDSNIKSDITSKIQNNNSKEQRKTRKERRILTKNNKL